MTAGFSNNNNAFDQGATQPPEAQYGNASNVLVVQQPQQQQPIMAAPAQQVFVTLPTNAAGNQLDVLPSPQRYAVLQALQRSFSVVPDEQVLFVKRLAASPTHKLLAVLMAFFLVIPMVIIAAIFIGTLRPFSMGIWVSLFMLFNGIYLPLFLLFSLAPHLNRSLVLTNHRAILAYSLPLARRRGTYTSSFWYSSLTRDIFCISQDRKGTYSINMRPLSYNYYFIAPRSTTNNGLDGIRGLNATNYEMSQIESIIRAHSPFLQDTSLTQPFFYDIHPISCPATVPYFLSQHLTHAEWQQYVLPELLTMKRRVFATLLGVFIPFIVFMLVAISPAFSKNEYYIELSYLPIMFITTSLFMSLPLAIVIPSNFGRIQQASDITIRLQKRFAGKGLYWRFSRGSMLLQVGVMNQQPPVFYTNTNTNTTAPTVPVVSAPIAAYPQQQPQQQPQQYQYQYQYQHQLQQHQQPQQQSSAYYPLV